MPKCIYPVFDHYFWSWEFLFFFFSYRKKHACRSHCISCVTLKWVAVVSRYLLSNILFLNNVGNMEEDLLLVVPYWGFSVQKRNDQLDLEMKLLPSAFSALTFCTSEDLPSSTRDLLFLHSSAHCGGCFPASGLPLFSCCSSHCLASESPDVYICIWSSNLCHLSSFFPFSSHLFPQITNIYCAITNVLEISPIWLLCNWHCNIYLEFSYLL